MSIRKITICVLFLACLSSTAMSAKGFLVNKSREKGYSANVEIGGTFIDSFGFRPELLTSHGYSFGNGLYVGGGIGLGYESWEIRNRNNRIFLPFFADVKYSFLKRAVSPFVSMKAGGMLDCSGLGIGYMLMPSIGVDLWRFSLSVGYQNYSCSYNVLRYETVVPVSGEPLSSVGLGSARFGGSGIKIGLSYTF